MDSKKAYLCRLVVLCALCAAPRAVLWAAEQDPSSGYHRFDRWGVTFEYPKSFDEWPQDRVQLMKEFLSNELAKRLEQADDVCGDRSLREFTTLVPKDETVAIIVTKLEFDKEPGADGFLRERRSVLEDAKTANDVTKVQQLEKAKMAGCDAVREDVERSNGGRGVCLHLLDGKTVYGIAWVVNDKTRFGESESQFAHLVETLQVHSKAGTVLQEPYFELRIPLGWTRTSELPQGVEYGFLKRLPGDRDALFTLHCEIMPDEFGGPSDDTAGMEQQFDRLVKAGFPDAKPLETPPVQVPGTIILNTMYELTDGGARVRRRYTYFLAERTAFVIQASAPPDEWDQVVNEFDKMLADLKPRTGAKAQKITEEETISELKVRLPLLSVSLPPPWACSVEDVGIVRVSAPESGSTLAITVKWRRSDIARIYEAVKTMFEMMKQGKTSEQDFQNLPADLKSVSAEDGSGFTFHVGQVWGCAWGVAANCQPPLDRIQVVILDPQDQRVGALSVSAQDARDILSGKISPSDGQRVSRIYQFE